MRKRLYHLKKKKKENNSVILILTRATYIPKLITNSARLILGHSIVIVQEGVLAYRQVEERKPLAKEIMEAFIYLTKVALHWWFRYSI